MSKQVFKKSEVDELVTEFIDCHIIGQLLKELFIQLDKLMEAWDKPRYWK